MKKKIYNENYFESIDSEDKAYFLGLILADGSVTNNEEKYRYQLTLKLHNRDRDILENFIKCIDGEMDIWKNNKREMSEIFLSGKKLISDLEVLGVTPNKTFSVKYPIIDEKLEKHFLRGYFDGDGCIRVNKDKRDGTMRGDLRIVSGSVDMLNKINERMNLLFGTNINKLYGPKNKQYRFIGWAGMKDIENIYNGFYSDCNFFIQRKKIIFDSVMEIIKNKQKYRKK
jgi:DNA-binding transcriptional regulator WhiA